MEKQKYYSVPITTKGVKYSGTSLMEMLKAVDYELWEMEIYKINLKYDFVDLSKEEMIVHENEAKRVDRETKAAFNLKKLPERIIVVKDENGIYELTTMLPITVLSEGFLDVFRVTSEEVIEQFVDNEDYSTLVTNLFNEFISKGKVLEKGR